MALPIVFISGLLKSILNFIKPYIGFFLVYLKARKEGHQKAKAQANEHFIEKSQEISDAVDVDRRKRVREPDSDDPYERD